MDPEEEAAKGWWHWKAASRTIRWSVKAISPGWQLQIAWKRTLPTTHTPRTVSAICTARMWKRGNMEGTLTKWRMEKEATYAVRLTPGVKGLVHLCCTWDGYHSAESLSKGIARSASRPGGRQRTVSAYAASLTKYFRTQARLTPLKLWSKNF